MNLGEINNLKVICGQSNFVRRVFATIMEPFEFGRVISGISYFMRTINLARRFVHATNASYNFYGKHFAATRYIMSVRYRWNSPARESRSSWKDPDEVLSSLSSSFSCRGCRRPWRGPPQAVQDETQRGWKGKMPRMPRQRAAHLSFGTLSYLREGECNDDTIGWLHAIPEKASWIMPDDYAMVKINFLQKLIKIAPSLEVFTLQKVY